MGLTVGSSIPDIESVLLLDGSHSDVLHVMKQQPALIHFWAVSCPVCHANMPYIHEISNRYKGHELQVIPVHRPRGDSDLDMGHIRQSAVALGVYEQCIVDNDHAIGDAFDVGGVWPVYFLFGADGKLKRHAAGGFGVKMMESALKKMFEETSPATETG